MGWKNISHYFIFREIKNMEMAGQMACFASHELTKHGWSAGKGLGKDEHGIKEAIKVKRKNNTSGLGLNIAEQFTYHWWDHAFNKAAKSISVDATGDEVKLSKSESMEPLSTSKVSKYLNGKPLLYGTFVKAGSLVPGVTNVEVEDKEDSSSSEDEDDYSSKDTLEKTFKMTGLTGHKGARHGHSMSGKLKRILEQESNATPSSSPEHNKEADTNEPVAKKKKKKKKETGETSNMNEVSDKSDTNETIAKKKKKLKKSKNSEETIEMVAVSDIVERTKEKKKKKKKMKARTDELTNGTVDEEGVSSKDEGSIVKLEQKEKFKSQKTLKEDESELNSTLHCSISAKPDKVPKKKKKNKQM